MIRQVQRHENEGVLAKAILPVLSKDKAIFVYKKMQNSGSFSAVHLGFPVSVSCYSYRYIPIPVFLFFRITPSPVVEAFLFRSILSAKAFFK